jgi:glycosyltransferase involved in cell wall biosynthesis
VKNLRIAIFSPNQNPYSETFIQAHKNHLKGCVFYYYGKKNVIELEGQRALTSRFSQFLLKAKKLFFKKSPTFVTEEMVLTSLKKNAVEVVLAEYGTHAYNILPIVKKAGLPLVVHFHGFDASVLNAIKRCHHYREVFQYAKKVIAVSKKMHQMLLEIGCPPEKLVYNVYGPRSEFMDVQCAFSKNQFVTVGRFTDKKAPYYTILAFKEVLKRHPHATLVLGGDGVLVNSCKNLVKLYKLEESVHFLGVITSEKYIQLLEESLAFVQHSITADNGDMEGTPLSILESSAAGIPVIATDHAGISDVILHQETGLLCKEHAVQGMTQNMLQLLEDKELAKTLGANGKKRIKEHFSLSRHISELQNILQEAADS